MPDATDATREGSANDLLCRAMQLRAVSADKRTAEFVASTDALDSHGEVVEQVWDLARFNANPVVLYNHNRFGADLPIGSADAKVASGALVCTITFVSAKANPLAEQVWQSIQEGSLRAVSVGFRPKTTRMEQRDGKPVLVLSDNVLHVISVVPIPSNPETLARARARALATPVPNPSGTAATTERSMAETQAGELLLRADVFLPLTARLGIAASSDDDACQRLCALAAEALETRTALGLAPAAARTEVTARLAERAVALADLPKVAAERDALKAEKAAREAEARDGHVAALIEAKPALEAAKAALVAYATADYAGFCKTYPLPKPLTARERTLSERQAPGGGATPESLATEGDDDARGHSAKADKAARELMAKDPTKYAGDDGYERALTDASRALKGRK